MGDPKRPAWRMEWNRTLEGMVKHGTRAKCLCVVCGRSRVLDVPDLARRLGGQVSLWDYFMPCDFCPDGLTFVSASPGGGTPVTPMKSYNIFVGSDGDFTFLPIWRDTPPFMNGIG